MKIKILVFLLSVLVLSGCKDESNVNEIIKEIPVKTAKVIIRPISIPIHRSVILATTTEPRLSFKIGGIIDRIYVDEGESVSKGQILATLNLSEIMAQVNLAQSNFEKSSRDMSRIKKLFRDSVATLEQKQNLETALAVAKANLQIAEFNLKHARIVAPEKGRILKIFAEENEMIGPGNPAFYFGSMQDQWIVRLGMSDREIILIQLGDSAQVSFDAYPDIMFPATITEISESVDPMSGTFEVELILKDQNIKLISGFVAKANILPSVKKEYTFIPIESLVEADKTAGYVYVLSDSGNFVQKKLVETGPIIGNQIIINSGLDSSDQVITEGSAYLTEQSRVKIIR